MSDLNPLRHSAAHLLAAAVLKLYPDAKPTIGPAIENGFYYDFAFPKVKSSDDFSFPKVKSSDDFEFKNPISESHLVQLEKEMLKQLPQWTEFTKREVTEQEARQIYKDNKFKLELIDEIIKKGEKITLYKSGDFEDLCRGGHLDNPSKEIGAIKLLSLAGAYWRGDEKNEMLTRIYGTAFPTKKELDDYLLMLEEARKRDHKKLGSELRLLMFHETSPGMPYWLPKGVVVYNQLVDFWRKEHEIRGYKEIISPLVNKKALYETSGHWEHYKENMFISETEDGEVYGLKAMNCPNAMIVFGSQTRSYRELPLRLSDTDTLHRYELSGTLNGLFRVREFRQDDAHIFVIEDQIKEEYERIFEIVERFYSIFDISYSFRLGTRPEKFMGDVKTWDRAEKELEQILKDSKKDYAVEDGDGAFYGPKVDILMKDSLGRSWQMGTIQLDFQQPRNFKLTFADNEGKEITPVVIHRVIYGSLERFIGILIEHFAGKFPTWLAPIQVQIIPVSEKFTEYANRVYDEIKSHGVRAEIDSSNNTLGNKIREATLQKVPYMCIIGGQEEEKSKSGKMYVSGRTRDGKDLGSLEANEFIESILKEIEKKH